MKKSNAKIEEPPIYKEDYRSLKTIFFMAFGLILLLSSSVVGMTYFRIINFQSLLDNTIIQSLPKVMTHAKMYRQVNELSYATSNLITVNTQIQRKTAYQYLQDKMINIPNLAKKLGDERRFLIQLNVIKNEIEELNNLIEQRLLTQKQLDEHQKDIYAIYLKINQNKTFEQLGILSSITSAIVIARQALTFKTLNQIKKNTTAVHSVFNLLPLDKSTLTNDEKKLIATLRTLLIGEKSILSLRSLQLKIFGRTRGRTEFVRNLVIDYAHLAEYNSFRYNKGVIQKTANFAEMIEQQKRILGIFAIVVIIFLIMIVFFIQHRFINRLILLNRKVLNRLAGQPSTLLIGGNDEITDISNSFDQFDQTIEQQKQKLIKTSLTDSLTDIPNRRGLDKEFKHQLRSAQRQQWPVAVLMMDVDNFKLYNDFYGHVMGDECLYKIALVLKSILQRPEDYVARYGGEEFVCLLPNTSTEGAEKIALDIINAMANGNIEHQKSEIANHVTLSIGISICHTNEKTTCEKLLKQADTALYRAKEEGKNRFSY